MIKLFALPCLCLLAFVLPTKQSAPTTVVQSFVDTPHMKQYWLVQLFAGSNRSQDTAAASKIQAAHIANIERLHREGSLIMAGPMGYDKDWRGLFILDAKDSATAASLVNTDPAVKAGRLRFEIHPWWCQTGTYVFK